MSEKHELSIDPETVEAIIAELREKYPALEKAYDEALNNLPEGEDPEIEKELMKEFVDQQNQLNKEIEEYKNILKSLQTGQEEAA